MLTFHKYEGKNKDIVKQNCLDELNVEESNIYLNYEESESGLFKGKKVILEAITKDEIISSMKNFIKELALNMNLEITSEINFNENVINILLVANNNNILIGKDGRTLNAIQVVFKQAYSELNKFGLKLIIDISNYRAKKVKNLQFEVKKICKEVLNTKMDIKLDSMNSYERRIVHEVVSNFDNLKSESVGEEPNRYTVIKYKED